MYIGSNDAPWTINALHQQLQNQIVQIAHCHSSVHQYWAVCSDYFSDRRNSSVFLARPGLLGQFGDSFDYFVLLDYTDGYFGNLED